MFPVYGFLPFVEHIS